MGTMAPERHDAADQEPQEMHEQPARKPEQAARLTPAEIMRKQLELYDEHTRQHQPMDADQLVEAARRRVEQAGRNFDELPLAQQIDAMHDEQLQNEAKRDVDKIVGDVAHMVPRPQTDFQKQYNQEFQNRMAESRQRAAEAATAPGREAASQPSGGLRHRVVHGVRRWLGGTGRHRRGKQ